MANYNKSGYPVRYLSVAEGKRLNIDSYPSFSKSGSLTGMRKNYGWDKAIVVLCGSYYYSVPLSIWSQAKPRY